MAIANITGNILTDTGVSTSSLISGTGTTNYHAKFTGASTLGNSLIWDNGTNVGIGNTNTSFTFDVTGTGRFTGALTSGALLTNAASGAGGQEALRINNDNGYIGFFNSANSTRTGYLQANASTDITLMASQSIPILFGTAATERMRITSTGNVGIGTSSPLREMVLYRASGEVHFKLANGTTGQGTTDGFDMAIDGSGGAYLINRENQPMFFFTNGTERMRITSTGSVGIAVNPKSYASTWAGFQVGNFSLMGPNPASDQNAILGANAYRASDNSWKRIIGGYGNVIEFNQGSGDIRFYTGGTGSADSTISLVSGPFLVNGGASWTNGSSDIRKKKNFEPSQGLAEVLQIEAVKYHFNWDDDNSIKRLGFKAQNLQTIIPEMVMETGEIAEDGTSYLTITPDYILPVLVKAIQELSAKVENQQQTINSLINR